ncbi:MAG: Smr/MutS family protein [Gemmatimonadota bacterium]
MAARLESANALELLDWPDVLEVISVEAATEAGREHVRRLRPGWDLDAAELALSRADEMLGLLLTEPEWAVPPIPDVRPCLKRLAVEGTVLAGEELTGLSVLLASARRARSDLGRLAADRPLLQEIRSDLLENRPVEERLTRSFDASGELADSASPRLKKIRGSLRRDRSRLVRRLEDYAARLPARHQVSDASVTIRAGRYCIPVRREGGSQAGGIVHDRSSTGQTLFVEPQIAVEAMNGILSLVADEATEVRLIFEALTDVVRPLRSELAGAYEALAELDSLVARGRYALRHGGTRPRLGSGSDAGYRIVEGLHPLLLDVEPAAVPFDLEMSLDEAVLLVSGPNAGGKTVLLKAIGLLSMMAQSGIVPPVGPGTRLPVFGSLFVAIGDDQSIEASLSTFSAQLETIKTILAAADDRTLVLFDELGGSTDPEEGAALAASVLLSLSDQALLTVATTHLGSLKALATEEPRIVNASLAFDTGAIQPTFQLRRDLPGRSYALEIAERLGLPGRVIEEARRRLSAEHSRVEDLLADLETRERALAADEERVRRDLRRLEEAGVRVSRDQAELDARSAADLAEARTRSEKAVLEARREIEAVIERLRNEYARDPDVAARRARVDSERLLDRVRSMPAGRGSGPHPVAAAGGPETPDAEPGLVQEGHYARSQSLGTAGRVIELRAREAVLLVNGVRVTLPRSDLVPAHQSEAAAPHSGHLVRPAGDAVAHTAVSEVDLRGLRADEAESALALALDAATVGDLPYLRIIHGKGTGVLRAMVERFLKAEPRAPRYRIGDPEEGGTGVTIIEFT